MGKLHGLDKGCVTVITEWLALHGFDWLRLIHSWLSF